MRKNLFILLLISTITGLLAGLSSSVFLYLLIWVSTLRENNLWLIWGLPFFGFFFGILIKCISPNINQGVPYILHEFEDHESKISSFMTPFILLSSLGTHLFGGSAGREGVGIIMGVSMAHIIPIFRNSYKVLRPYLIYNGIAAGFSSIFGTPLAGIIFAFELHSFKDFKKVSFLFSTIMSSFIACSVSHFLGPVHQHFKVSFEFNSLTFFYILIASITSGIGAQIFYWSLKYYKKLIINFIPQVEWKLFIGGFAISFIVYFTNSFGYIGIGTDFIARSFVMQMKPFDFMMKCLLTIMTLSVGFKGGEVTPLFFMGATFSNSIASLFNLKNYSFSSAMGMVSMFGAVTGTPITSGVLGIELFGMNAGLCSFVSCLIARFIMGHRTIYRN